MMCYTLDVFVTRQQGKWKCLPDYRRSRNRQDYVTIFALKEKKMWGRSFTEEYFN